VPEPVKSARLARLQELIAAQTAAFQESMLDRTLDVLLEKPGRHPGQLAGRSPYLQAVHLDARDAEIGDVVRARIVAVGPNSLKGDIVGDTAAGARLLEEAAV